MAQQTAVEWLYNQLDGFSDEEWGKIDKVFEQAKQMEKHQIIQAFDTGCEDEDRIGREYYEETYKNK